jgi:hypothetical protein
MAKETLIEHEHPLIGQQLRVLHLSKSEKVHLIARMVAQVAKEDLLFGDGRTAIDYDCLLQIPVKDEEGNLLYQLRIA